MAEAKMGMDDPPRKQDEYVSGCRDETAAMVAVVVAGVLLVKALLRRRG